MKRCYGYMRVSTARQGEGVSLSAQREAIALYAERCDIEIIDWYEEMETAAKEGRAVFHEMVGQLRKGKADGLITYKVDRSTRNYFDWWQINKLADEGIEIHFATEGIDFTTRSGRLAADIHAVFATEYIRNLKAEIRKGQLGQLKNGVYPFKAPIGYLDNGKNALKTPDPVRAPLVRQTFELYALGQHTFPTLVEEMSRRGLTNTNGGKLSVNSVEKMLRNPFYAGRILIRRTGACYEGAHEPIISTDLFKRVQEMKAGRYGKKLTKHNHLFRGMFTCAGCQRLLVGEMQKGRCYYRCHDKGCSGGGVREDRAIEALKTLLTEHAPKEAELDRLCEELARRLEDSAKASTLSALKAQLAQLEAKLERLTDALIDRLIDEDAFQRRRDAIYDERARLRDNITDLEGRRLTRDDIQEFLAHVRNVIETFEKADQSAKREILILVSSNRKLVGKNLEIEPSNWLQRLNNAEGLCQCALEWARTRTEKEGSNRKFPL